MEDFTEEFRRRYGAEYVSALHHNRRKTNKAGMEQDGGYGVVIGDLENKNLRDKTDGNIEKTPSSV